MTHVHTAAGTTHNTPDTTYVHTVAGITLNTRDTRTYILLGPHTRLVTLTFHDSFVSGTGVVRVCDSTCVQWLLLGPHATLVALTVPDSFVCVTRIVYVQPIPSEVTFLKALCKARS